MIDPSLSWLKDQTNLTEEIGRIISGKTEDLQHSVRRAAFMMTRLGNITEQPSRALLTAALLASPHPQAPLFADRLQHPDISDEISFATQRHIEWLESSQHADDLAALIE